MASASASSSPIVDAAAFETLTNTVKKFVEDECIPAEATFADQMKSAGRRWGHVPPIVEHLKQRAKELEIWNLWLTREYDGVIPSTSPGGCHLDLQQYASLCEILGRSPALAPEACNSSAPDTGNMEVLLKYGSESQRTQWLAPLLRGDIRSSFLMTEPEVASSDATNIQTSITREGDSYVINGRKWWSSGAMDPRCKIAVLMGKTDPAAAAYSQQSMILVPMDAPGLKIVRPLTVFGYDDAPHGHAEILLENVRVPASYLILGEGRGFEIAQGRLGPGRIHHCMRSIGMGERAMEAMLKRITTRVAFGKPLARHGTIQTQLAECRMKLDTGRALVMHCARMVDLKGGRAARKEVSLIKVYVPRVVCEIIDTAIQMHGGLGVCQDTHLAHAYAGMRSLRIADGPDDVHLRTVALLEIRDYLRKTAAADGAPRPKL